MIPLYPQARHVYVVKDEATISEHDVVSLVAAPSCIHKWDQQTSSSIPMSQEV